MCAARRLTSILSEDDGVSCGHCLRALALEIQSSADECARAVSEPDMFWAVLRILVHRHDDTSVGCLQSSVRACSNACAACGASRRNIRTPDVDPFRSWLAGLSVVIDTVLCSSRAVPGPPQLSAALDACGVSIEDAAHGFVFWLKHFDLAVCAIIIARLLATQPSEVSKVLVGFSERNTLLSFIRRALDLTIDRDGLDGRTHLAVLAAVQLTLAILHSSGIETWDGIDFLSPSVRADYQTLLARIDAVELLTTDLLQLLAFTCHVLNELGQNSRHFLSDHFPELDRVAVALLGCPTGPFADATYELLAMWKRAWCEVNPNGTTNQFKAYEKDLSAEQRLFWEQEGARHAIQVRLIRAEKKTRVQKTASSAGTKNKDPRRSV
ncbi:hypothetical protein AURDEDRAFT_157886 [Auricularia subglabra TFB-10046 SS5]|nr:hypothetical protein AURDEDRAFT_157886 [Auricularia subglabra TFB-10046 SS5]